MNKLGKWILLATALIGIERFCHLRTDGFRLLNIQSDLSFDPRFSVPPLDPLAKEALDPVLSQRFFYYNSGAQMYAFISADRSTIIKFFKHHHMRPDHPIHKVPLPSGLNKKRIKVIGNPSAKIEAVFASCKMAYTDLREESGLLALHLNKTREFAKPLVLVDKLGIEHEVDLNNTEFVLQKRAEPIFTRLKRLMKQNQTETAKKAIRTFIQFAAYRCHKGIADKDNALKRNIGFVGDAPVMIDIGSLVYNDAIRSGPKFEKELRKKTNGLQKWLKRYYPSLYPVYQSELESCLAH